ncbi:MAG: YicC/YloC family endoribonuclease [Caldimicrobium sp.]
MESMTGFGRAIYQNDDFQIIVQAKSVNHRFLDITLRLPKRYSSLEERIRKRVAELFSRGKIEISIRILGLAKEKREIFFDLELAKKLKENLLHLKETLLLPGEITLSEILTFREITLFEEKEEDLELLWNEVEPALETSLKDLKEGRLREGALLKEKIKDFLSQLKSIVLKIEELKEKIKTENIQKMKERVTHLLKELGSELDEGRLYQEIAFLLDRLDITEEIDRLKVHIENALKVIDEPSCGKKLDFLCQEMHREITTLSNKAQSAEISLLAVSAKDLVEKIREQVQNVV